MVIMSENFAESRSVEETNALRSKLGLKPLAVKASIYTNERQVTEQNKNTIEEPQRDIDSRVAREFLIRGDTIIDTIEKERRIAKGRKKVGTKSDETSPSDILKWVKFMGSLNAKKQRESDEAVMYSDDEINDKQLDSVKGDHVEDRAKLKVLHKIDELPLNTGEEVVLTLTDVGVLEAEAAGVSDINFLENADLASRKRHEQKFKRRKQDCLDYDPYDEETQGERRDILDHYDDTMVDRKKELNNMLTDKNGFFIDSDNLSVKNINKSLSNTLDDPLEDSKIIFARLQRKKELIRSKSKPISWKKLFGAENPGDDVQDNESECVQSVVKKNVEPDIDDIEGCTYFYNQLAKYRNKMSSSVKKEATTENSELSIGKKSVIDARPLQEAEGGIQINATSEFCNIVKTQLENIDQTIPSSAEAKQSSDKVEKEGEEYFPENEATHAYSEQVLSMGIAEALSYLKEKGDLIEKPRKESIDDVGNDVQLHYIDSYGKPMTPKEAFRQISWVFHGKGPGMNKRERKLKRMERERSAREDPVKGLPTMKALLSHQAEHESTYLVLSGNSNIP